MERQGLEPSNSGRCLWSLVRHRLRERSRFRRAPQRAADLGETEPALYVTLGDAYAGAGDAAQARAAYQRALQVDPYYAPAIQRLAAQ